MTSLGSIPALRGLLPPVLEAVARDRAKRRAVEWLADNSLIDDDSAGRFLSENSDPEVP